MDKFDKQIIDILQANARASVSDIARDINLSRSAVTARIKKLEQDNVILGYHAQIAKPEQCNNVSAYFALKFDTSASLHSCERYAQKMYLIPGVKWCHAISGETDMMLFVEAESMAKLNEIRDELQNYPQLRQLMTHTVLKELFNTAE